MSVIVSILRFTRRICPTRAHRALNRSEPEELSGASSSKRMHGRPGLLLIIRLRGRIPRGHDLGHRDDLLAPRAEEGDGVVDRLMCRPLASGTSISPQSAAKSRKPEFAKRPQGRSGVRNYRDYARGVQPAPSAHDGPCSRAAVGSIAMRFRSFGTARQSCLARQAVGCIAILL